ncbi:MAG: hypothetical protein ACFCD0_21685 [Gemmataceae bacterium]
MRKFYRGLMYWLVAHGCTIVDADFKAKSTIGYVLEQEHSSFFRTILWSLSIGLNTHVHNEQAYA